MPSAGKSPAAISVALCITAASLNPCQERVQGRKFLTQVFSRGQSLSQRLQMEGGVLLDAQGRETHWKHSSGCPWEEAEKHTGFYGLIPPPSKALAGNTFPQSARPPIATVRSPKQGVVSPLKSVMTTPRLKLSSWTGSKQPLMFVPDQGLLRQDSCGFKPRFHLFTPSTDTKLSRKVLPSTLCIGGSSSLKHPHRRAVQTASLCSLPEDTIPIKFSYLQYRSVF